MKKQIKWGIIGIIILISAAGTVIAFMMPMPVRMTEVTARVAELTFTEQGIMTAENTILVFPATQGELRGIYISEGQHVNAGDILISVDKDALNLQLEQVQSSIRGLEAQLASVYIEDAVMRQNLISTRNSLLGELQRINAQAYETNQVAREQSRIQQILIEQQQNELNRANEHFNRVSILHQNGAVSQAQLDAAYDAVTAAQGALEAAHSQAAVIAAGAQGDGSGIFEGMRTSITAQIDGINQQLGQDTTSAAHARFEAMIEVEKANATRIEREIANSNVATPVSGIITILHAQNTNFISAATPIAEITVPGAMSVDVYVSTQDIGSINVGDIVGLTLRQRFEDVEFTGNIVNIGSTAVVRHTVLGVEERKVNVEIEPHIPQGVNIGVGHALDVTFNVFREENQIIVPRTAVFHADSQDMVWAVRGGNRGRVEAVSVETGRELRADVIILSGLREGDFVVNNANNADISQGTRVVGE